MPYYSTFWDKHYGDIGNCCMTKPLEEFKVSYKKDNHPIVEFMDVDWMKDKKLKWFGWDKDGYYSWTTPGGMIYHIEDLKRNDLGKEYEKENDKIKDEPRPDDDHIKGFDSKKDFYEWEVYAQSKCQFCQSTSQDPGNSGGGRDIEDKDSGIFSSEDGGGPVKENTDWKQYAAGNSDPNPVTNNDYVKEPQKYAGGPYGPPDGYSNPYIPTGPYGPPNGDTNPYLPSMPGTPPAPPSDVPPYTPPPPRKKPPVILQPENPVTKRSSVLDNVDTTTPAPNHFKELTAAERYKIAMESQEYGDEYKPEDGFGPDPQDKKDTTKNNNNNYDVNKAVEKLDKQAYPKYDRLTCGHCAQKVREAIEAGGIILDKPQSGSAKDYGTSLTNKGFNTIDAINYKPEKGDIAIFDKFDASPRGGNHPNGHMQMYDGTQWVSDFKQNSDEEVGDKGKGFWAGGDFRNQKPDYKIYRK